jgi:hypothetical protein
MKKRILLSGGAATEDCEAGKLFSIAHSASPTAGESAGHAQKRYGF